MVLCFAGGLGINKDEIDLCLVPDKPDILSVPIRISDMFDTVAAFIRLGPEEGVNVKVDEQDGGIIITALSGAPIYLTPNLNLSPGYKVKKMKIFKEEGQYRTYFEREGKGWEEWISNRERE